MQPGDARADVRPGPVSAEHSPFGGLLIGTIGPHGLVMPDRGSTTGRGLSASTPIVRRMRTVGPDSQSMSLVVGASMEIARRSSRDVPGALTPERAERHSTGLSGAHGRRPDD